MLFKCRKCGHLSSIDTEKKSLLCDLCRGFMYPILCLVKDERSMFEICSNIIA